MSMTLLATLDAFKSDFEKRSRFGFAQAGILPFSVISVPRWRIFLCHNAAINALT
jgi:hypothetical protein